MHMLLFKLSAFSICLNIYGWELMICLGFLGAACSLFSVRVPNELGKGNANAVRFSIKVLVATSVLIGVFSLAYASFPVKSSHNSLPMTKKLRTLYQISLDSSVSRCF